MRRTRFAFAFGVTVLLLVLPQAASAKEGLAIRVVTPSGKLGWVRGQAAAAWWQDFDQPGKRGCSCTSADAAARYARRLFKRFTSPGHYWPTAYTAWLLSAENGAMLYYPPTPLPYGTPGVVLTPAAQGANGRRWDDWQVASPRMQNILRLALQQGTVTTYSGSSGLPIGWAVGGGLGALLVAAVALRAWRRADHCARVRPSHRLSS